MVINIVMPDIEAMHINGSGDVEVTGVDNDELDLSINGSGDLTVSGKTNALDIGINLAPVISSWMRSQEAQLKYLSMVRAM